MALLAIDQREDSASALINILISVAPHSALSDETLSDEERHLIRKVNLLAGLIAAELDEARTAINKLRTLTGIKPEGGSFFTARSQS